jgi:hypothetical protein
MLLLVFIDAAAVVAVNATFVGGVAVAVSVVIGAEASTC